MARDKSRKRTKYVPTVKVWADDYVLTDEESQDEYYPHAGEYVTFQQAVALGVLRSLANIRSAQAIINEDSDEEGAVTSASLFEDLISLVFGQIVDWSLTTDDVDEEATQQAQSEDPDAEIVYIRHPSPKHNREMAMESMWTFNNLFLNWLQEHMMAGATVPNGQNLPSPAT